MTTPPGPAARLGVAVRLLTRVPLPAPAGGDTPEDLRAAVPYFPAVGALVAGVGIGVRAAGGWLIGAGPGTVLAVAAMVAVTGALHEDGLADTFDGLAGRTPARRLEIMRDSHVGTYGVCALLAALLLRVSLLAPLGLGDFAPAVVGAHVLGRAAGAALVGTLPAAPGSALGATVAGPGSGPPGAVILAAVGAAAVAAGSWLVVPLSAAALIALGGHLLARRALGGITGDVLGATTVVAELAVLGSAVALGRAGLV